MTRALSFSVNAHVATITLARPELRNAFGDEMVAEITEAFTSVGERSDVRAVVLAAEGPAFCAGADLNWMRRMAEYSRDENRADAGALAAMLRAVHECPKPTIARVQGDAYAGGVGLVACCDMAVAAEGAGFCLSEVKIGLIPATISPYVIRAMGARAAHRYLLTGERFSAGEARRIGLVHEVAQAGQLDTVVDGWLEHLLGAGPDAVRACKRLVIDVAGREIDEQLIAATVESIAGIRAGNEAREGIAAFLARRAPAWLS